MSRRTVRPGLVWSGGLVLCSPPRHKQSMASDACRSPPSSLTFAHTRHWTPCRAVRQSRARSALWRAGLYSLATFLRLCAPSLPHLTLPSPLSRSPQTLHATFNDVPPLVSVFPVLQCCTTLMVPTTPQLPRAGSFSSSYAALIVPIPHSYADLHPRT